MDLKNFENYLTRKTKVSTAKWYIKTLGRMFAVIGNKTPTADEIEQYLQDLKTSGRKGTYLNGLIMGIKRYGEYMNDSSYKEIKPFKKEKVVKEILTVEEINNLINLKRAPTSNRETHERWSMFFNLLANFGLRAGECMSLKVSDVDTKNSIISIRDGKTGARKLPIPTDMSQEIEEYIESRKLQNDDLLFASKSGRTPLSGEWSQQFHYRLKRLGIDRPNLSVHCLRHSFISRLAKNSGDLFATMRLVGHSNPETTMVYTHLDMTDVKKLMSKDPLRKSAISISTLINEIEERLNLLKTLVNE